jgi:tellurite methyltransferase
MSETFSKPLKLIRKEKGYTQLELTTKLGVYDNCISQYETGRHEPTLSRIEWLCKVLEVTATELLGF